MPELPEVETIIRQLKPQILYRKIEKVNILREKQWHGIAPPDAIAVLTNNEFLDIARRGKYIVFMLPGDFRLIIHLRMSGKLIYTKKWQPIDSYSRTIFCFDDGSSLQLNDTRALGTIEVIYPQDQLNCLKKLGIEPLGEDFELAELNRLLTKSRLAIKDFLMDQTKIVGIGNIYANEILFRCGIHPQRVAQTLTPEETERLFQIICQVLQQAIAHMGTTLGNRVSDYRSAYNMNGDFQSLLKVYDRKGKPCFGCGNPIVRIVQKGRSSYVCNECQR